MAHVSASRLQNGYHFPVKFLFASKRSSNNCCYFLVRARLHLNRSKKLMVRCLSSVMIRLSVMGYLEITLSFYRKFSLHQATLPTLISKFFRHMSSPRISAPHNGIKSKNSSSRFSTGISSPKKYLVIFTNLIEIMQVLHKTNFFIFLFVLRKSFPF